MTNIRRYFRPGHLYFLTHVTYNRMPILVKEAKALWDSIKRVRSEYPFIIKAWVILPDHFHILLHPLESNISAAMRRVKLGFSHQYRIKRSIPGGLLWQNRFGDHQIRDEDDPRRQVDYIHYNPVKHGLVDSPKEYQWSSFNEYLGRGYYVEDWGKQKALKFEGEYGE